MNNGYFEINDKLLESSIVANKFIRGKRFLLAFTIDRDITINGAPYRKMRSVDINIDNESIVLSKKKDKVDSNIMVKLFEFTFASIDYIDGDIVIKTK